MRQRTAGLGLLVALAVGAPGGAVPRVGGRLPVFDVPDLTGRVHTTRELVGRRTLVLAITETGGNEPLTAWSVAARTRVPAGVRRVYMVLLNLAFFIPTATARSSARDRTPEPAWGDTWLDVHNDRAEAAGLPGSPVPWAIALDEDGRILAAVHAPVTDPAADAVWAALNAPSP